MTFPIGTEINNQAGIYFDSNPPIITNTTKNILIDEIILSIDDPISQNQLCIFPVPTSDILFIKEIENLENPSASIYDMNGRMVMQAKQGIEQGISVRQLSSGVYFIKIVSGQSIQTARFIKK